MKRLARLAILGAALFLTTGCFEQVYISAAPDGTIAVSCGGALYTIDPEFTEAHIVEVGHKVVRAEYSPDGKRWLAVLDMGEGDERYFEIVLRDVAGRSASFVSRKDIGTDEGQEAQLISPRWSPDGTYISYLLPNPNEKEFSDLHINKVDGPFHFVISRVGSCYAWAGDSRRVAVVTTDAEYASGASLGSIQVWDVVEQKRLAEPAGLLFHPWLAIDWDTEGKDLFFAAHEFTMPIAGSPGFEDLALKVFRLDLESGGMKKVLPEPGLSAGMAGMFDVSPDAKRIVYVVWRPQEKTQSGALVGGTERRGDVFVANVDGSEAKKVVDDAKEVWTFPRWLDDRRFVCAYKTGDQEGDQMHISVVEPGGKTTDLWPLIEKAAQTAEAAKTAQ